MLPKDLRLRNRRDFKHVYQRGQKTALPTFTLYWRKNSGKSPRIGFSVSKKVGNAVKRNRLKRRFRALAYELLPNIPNCDLIFVIRPLASKADHSLLKKEINEALIAAVNKGHIGKPPSKTSRSQGDTP